MIHFINGVLAGKTENGVVVETGGMGYEISVPENSAIYLRKENEQVKLYTYMAVREDDISLYGFTDREGLKLFRMLITVNGVGAKAAISLLSSMPALDLIRAIAFEDAAALTKANGIGKKTAQRITLELKEKVGALGLGGAPGSQAAVYSEDVFTEDHRADALNALVALGYSKLEAVNALSTIAETDLTSEQYIKMALKKLF